VATNSSSQLKPLKMRKIHLAAIAFFICCLLLVNVSSAQDLAYHKASPKSSAYMLLTHDDYTEKNAPKTIVDKNYKLQKSFNKFFENAGNVNWYNVKRNYLAEFNNNGRRTRALFAKNGYIFYAISYGNEKDLSNDDYRSIKSMYFDFNVINVVEVYSKAVDYTTWLVLLQNKQNTVIARIIDGGVDEYARFNNIPKIKKQRKGHVLIPKS
jgi:hypothetical protein